MFILLPGVWFGQGTLQFTGVKDKVTYYTKWTIEPLINSEIFVQQIVELQGVEEKLCNQFRFFSFGSEGFYLEMENDIIGKQLAQGFLTEDTIGWQFRGSEYFNGIEVYQKQLNEDYHCHAHYESPDKIETIIVGKIWKRSEKS